MRNTSLPSTLYYLAIPFAAAATGIIFRPGSWYAALEKPLGTPPDIVFPIVWMTLYLLMGIAAVLVAQHPHPLRQLALRLFHLQLLCNALWSFLFFGLQRPLLGLLDIAALLATVALTLLAFRRVRALAGLLLWPYLAWLLYAAYLNAGILVLN